MASIFQPVLSEPSLPRDFERPATGRAVDYGFSSLVQGTANIGVQAEANSRAEKARADDATLGGVAKQLVDEKRRFLAVTLQGEELQRNADIIRQAKADGEITEEEAVRIKEVQDQLARHKSLLASGALSKVGYELRRSNIISQALSRDPHLIDVMNLSAKTNLPEAVDPSIEEQKQLTDYLDSTKGRGSWTLEDYNGAQIRFQRLANDKDAVASGAISMREMSSRVATGFLDVTYDIQRVAAREFRDNGAVSAETEAKLQEVVQGYRIRANALVREGIAKRRALGEQVTAEQINAITSDIAAQEKLLVDSFDSRSFLTVYDKYQKITQANLELAHPIAKVISGGSGTAPGQLGLLEAALDPDNAMSHLFLGEGKEVGAEAKRQALAYWTALVTGQNEPNTQHYKNFKSSALLRTASDKTLRSSPEQVKAVGGIVNDDNRSQVQKVEALSHEAIAGNINWNDPAIAGAAAKQVGSMGSQIMFSLTRNSAFFEFEFGPNGRILSVPTERTVRLRNLAGKGGDSGSPTKLMYRPPETDAELAWNKYIDMLEQPEYKPSGIQQKILEQIKQHRAASAKEAKEAEAVEVQPEAKAPEDKNALIVNVMKDNPNLTYEDVVKLLDK